MPISKELKLRKFWNRYFNFIRVSDVHMLEYVLDKCINFVKQGIFRWNLALMLLEKWDECKILLEPFPVLRPLLLLMTWHYFFDRYDAQVALSNLVVSGKA